MDRFEERGRAGAKRMNNHTAFTASNVYGAYLNFERQYRDLIAGEIQDNGYRQAFVANYDNRRIMDENAFDDFFAAQLPERRQKLIDRWFTSFEEWVTGRHDR